MDQGWCWGRNLSQHGKAGWFPKSSLCCYHLSTMMCKKKRPTNGGSAVYANYTRANASVLDRVILETASVCSKIDSLVADSTYLVSDHDRLSLKDREKTLSTIGPFTYLVSSTATSIWEAAFRNFLGAFEERKVHKVDYVMLIGRFRHLANELDKHVASLSQEVRNHPTIRPSLLDNALQMQTTLKSLLEIASLTLDASRASYTISTSHGKLTKLRLSSAPFIIFLLVPSLLTMTDRSWLVCSPVADDHPPADGQDLAGQPGSPRSIPCS